MFPFRDVAPLFIKESLLGDWFFQTVSNERVLFPPPPLIY
ncbi:hypothetical protein EVA_22024 [gut metagenome]|uniref:Uncharacterized protein n=1 Tax=gut metagenome TaxID=749906 RepID=J9F5U3_9ZZZZ